MIRTGRAGNAKILILDDEPEVLRSLADLLRSDFEVYATSDPAEALQVLGEGAFSVLISDQRMPDMNGAQVLSRAAVLSPNTRRILLTAYADIGAVIDAVNIGHVSHYITKPWDNGALLSLLRPVAHESMLMEENRRLMSELEAAIALGRSAADEALKMEAVRSTLEQDNLTLKSTIDRLRSSYWQVARTRELLPICMECGKVQGEGTAWADAASFLRQNTDFLSHGYCPECSSKVKMRLDEFLRSSDRTP